MKPLIIEMIAVSKAVSLHAYAAQGNLPRDARQVRLGPSIPEVAIVYPKRPF